MNTLFLVLFVIISSVDLTNKSGNSESRSFKYEFITCLAVSLVITIMIWSALYLMFTSVGSISIEGVQNRYFLPLLILVILSWPSIRIDRSAYESISYKVLLVATVLLGSVVLFDLAAKFTM